MFQMQLHCKPIIITSQPMPSAKLVINHYALAVLHFHISTTLYADNHYNEASQLRNSELLLSNSELLQTQ